MALIWDGFRGLGHWVREGFRIFGLFITMLAFRHLYYTFLFDLATSNQARTLVQRLFWGGGALLLRS